MALSKLPNVTGKEPQISRGATEIIQRAAAEARKMQDEFLTIEHLLLGFMESKDAAAQLLKDQGLNLKDLKTIIAEMRGVSDEEGHSPFWQWLQEHFFTIDFPTADHLIGIGNKVFISELMPKHPIYANLLGKEAQEVIGQVHEKTKPALKLLEKEGFEHRGYVDLFDAGPTV